MEKHSWSFDRHLQRILWGRTVRLQFLKGFAYNPRVWRTGGQEAEITATTIPPDDLESATVRTVAPGNYTAIVRGKDGTTGVALVEVYALE